MSVARTFVSLAALVVFPAFGPSISEALYAPGVSVTPDGSATPARDANSGPYTATFTVKNTGTSSDYFYITCWGISGVTCTGTNKTEVSLGAGQQTAVDAYYTTGGPGTGQLRLSAFSELTMVEDQGWYSVQIVSSLPTPEVDVTPYNYETQHMSRCAEACFAATYSHSTVPYFSYDLPRNVTLVYHGDRVNPKPFIHVNVRDSSAQGPDPSKYWLQVKRGGVLEYFANGEQTLKFTAASSSWQRLAGQLRDSTLSSGVYNIEIIVTADYGAQGTKQNTVQSKLVVVNEGNSQIARGWTVAGVQRVYAQGDGSALITEGDGSAVYFNKSGSNFITPDGEFSKLYTYGSGWRRLYPDSTDVRFDYYGYMTDVYDQFDNRTQFTYVSGRLNSIIDPYGAVIYLDYSSSPTRLYSIYAGISPFRYTYYTVQSSDRTLTSITDPDNYHTDFQYDGSGRL